MKILYPIFIFCTTNIYATIFNDYKLIEEAKYLYKNEKFEESTELFNKIHKSKNSYQSSYDLGNAYYKNGEFKKALKQYSKAISNDKSFEAKKLHNMGNCQVKLKEYEKAKKLYQKSLDLEFNEDTKYNLDLLNQDKDNQDKDNQDKDNQDKDNNITKNEIISDMEAKKWLKSIENKKQPSMLHQIYQNSGDKIENPW